jgi:DNA polymerase III alpha subunit
MDIDIDFLDRTKILDLIDHRVALRDDKGKKVKHYTGIYVQEIPHDPFTNISTIDYESAEARGYFKIDFLNVSLYEGVRDELHLIKLLHTEPVWELLEHQEIVAQLFHVNNHYNLVSKLKPTSIEQLAAVLAIIRPAKRHLQDYNWNDIMKEIWVKPDGEDLYFFKKSHAIAYACAIVVQLNLICERLTASDQLDMPALDTL